MVKPSPVRIRVDLADVSTWPWHTGCSRCVSIASDPEPGLFTWMNYAQSHLRGSHDIVLIPCDAPEVTKTVTVERTIVSHRDVTSDHLVNALATDELADMLKISMHRVEQFVTQYSRAAIVSRPRVEIHIVAVADAFLYPDDLPEAERARFTLAMRALPSSTNGVNYTYTLEN